LHFGAEFTQIYTGASGGEIVPAKSAEAITPVDRVMDRFGAAAITRGISRAPTEPTHVKESPRLVLGIVESKVRENDPSLTAAFLRAHPAAVLLSAVGCGLMIGLVLWQLERRPDLSSSDQFKTGAKALAWAGATATAAYFIRPVSPSPPRER
jgi:hypothetical protein